MLMVKAIENATDLTSYGAYSQAIEDLKGLKIKTSNTSISSRVQ